MASTGDESPDLWLGYPNPRNSSTIPAISPIEVHNLLTSGAESFQLIDVRRTDADVSLDALETGVAVTDGQNRITSSKHRSICLHILFILLELQ